MILLDVNVLIYAHRKDSDKHGQIKRWLEEIINTQQSLGLAEVVLSGFIRIATHPKVFKNPTPLNIAFEFVNTLRIQPNSIIIHPGIRHWDIFTHLAKTTNARGNLILDAYIAALAIETDAELISTDQDFKQFKGLNYKSPL